MSGDRLGQLMWSATIPDGASALERTLRAARGSVPTAPSSAATPARRRWRGSAWPARRAVALASAVLLATALLTAPGRDALGQAADLLGQIGGTPTVKDTHGLDPSVPAGRIGAPIVIDNGVAPDGSRYEWIAYRGKEIGLGKTFCVVFGWADAPRRKGTGGCSNLGSYSPGIVSAFQSRLIRRDQARSDAPDYMLIGTLSPRVHRLRIVYRRPNGTREELPVNLGRAEGGLLARAGGSKPFVTFAAFIPGATVRADRLDARYRLASLTTRAGSAFSIPGFVEQDLAMRCMQSHGGIYERGWIDFVAYDAADRQIAAIPTLTARPEPPACQRFRAGTRDAGPMGYRR
jgi:hypothetical protein